MTPADPVDPPPAKDLEAARAKMTDARDEALAASNDAQNALDLLPPAPVAPVHVEPPADPTVYNTPDRLDWAMSVLPPGSTLLVAPELVYPGPLKVAGVTLQNAAAVDGLASDDMPMPHFLQGATLGARAALLGLDIRHTNPLTDIVTVTGRDWIVRGCRIPGDRVKGGKRGIAGNGANGLIQNNRIDFCFGPYPGNDSQAICLWDTPGPLLIQGNYLRAGSETIMIGGTDASSPANDPCDIQILDNYIGADPAWQSLLIGVKSRLEIKNARRVLVRGNRVEYCWGKHGQDGYLLTLNVRNQNGKNPTATLQDIVVENNDFAHGAAAINILGVDNNHPSIRMNRVAITGNRFTDIDAVKYAGGVAKLIMLMGGASNLSIDNNTFAGSGLSSAVYFANGTYDNLNIRGNTFPKSSYKFFGNNIGSDVTKVLAAFVSSGDLSGNVVM